ncbi:unnamed protein product, partial [Vitis vinifera]|uniref:Uncharacterized protein n=1 Tax=Vitis vinifera TaxID=29760 RepID=D7U913_VITVI
MKVLVSGAEDIHLGLVLQIFSCVLIYFPLGHDDMGKYLPFVWILLYQRI